MIVCGNSRPLFLFLLILACYPAFASSDKHLHINKQFVSLSDRNITEQVQLELYPDNPEQFDLQILSPSHGGAHDKRYFYLKPTTPGGEEGQVKIALDLPYDYLTSGGPYQENSENTVVWGHQRTASNAYSSCPSSNSSKICKPLSFLVVDTGSVPGARYATRLTVVMTSGGKTTTQHIYISYHNTRSEVGIYSPRSRLSLNSRNHFTDSADFCVFSKTKSKFRVRLEGETNSRKAFTLRGTNNKGFLPYEARVYLNKSSSSKEAHPYDWLDGGTPINGKTFRDCRGDTNLKVEVHINNTDLRKAKADRYNGILTVRVSAR